MITQRAAKSAARADGYEERSRGLSHFNLLEFLHFVFNLWKVDSQNAIFVLGINLFQIHHSVKVETSFEIPTSELTFHVVVLLLFIFNFHFANYGQGVVFYRNFDVFTLVSGRRKLNVILVSSSLMLAAGTQSVLLFSPCQSFQNSSNMDGNTVFGFLTFTSVMICSFRVIVSIPFSNFVPTPENACIAVIMAHTEGFACQYFRLFWKN